MTPLLHLLCYASVRFHVRSVFTSNYTGNLIHLQNELKPNSLMLQYCSSVTLCFTLLANVNSRSPSLYVVVRLSIVCHCITTHQLHWKSSQWYNNYAVWNKKTQIHTNTNKSTHSEMCPVRQNPIQRTVRTAHLSVLMTMRNFSTQYNTEQFW